MLEPSAVRQELVNIRKKSKIEGLSAREEKRQEALWKKLVRKGWAPIPAELLRAEWMKDLKALKLKRAGWKK